MEKYLALYRHLHGLDYRVLRISNAYGEGQQPDRPQGLIGVVLRRIAAGEPIQVWGDGQVVRDYVYAGDVVDCCMRAARTTLPADGPRIFNVGSQQGHSVSEILSTVFAVTGREPSVHHTPARRFDVPRSVLSSRLAHEVLGWQARTPLDQGVARTWQWVLRTAATEEGVSRDPAFD
jgi:UDP-glucose 4-epimerase